jgi:hypothetical protein
LILLAVLLSEQKRLSVASIIISEPAVSAGPTLSNYSDSAGLMHSSAAQSLIRLLPFPTVHVIHTGQTILPQRVSLDITEYRASRRKL